MFLENHFAVFQEFLDIRFNLDICLLYCMYFKIQYSGMKVVISLNLGPEIYYPMNKTRPDLKGCTRNSNHFAVCINFLMQMYIQLYFYGCIVYIIYTCCKLAIMWWWFLNLAWNKHVISEIAIIMWSTGLVK